MTSTLTRVGLAVVTILVLMLWILGAFKRGVIQPGKASVPAESGGGPDHRDHPRRRPSPPWRKPSAPSRRSSSPR